MSEYKTGKIYKIIHNKSNICYVGSTMNTLRDRWYNHGAGFKSFLKHGINSVSIYPYFKQYGIENFKIILIKEYKIIDKKHLFMWEQIWINKLRPINTMNALNFKFLNKEKIKKKQEEYDRNNKEQLKEQLKKYNKEILNKYKGKERNKIRNKIYYQNNKERLVEYNRKYRENNKEQIKKRDNKINIEKFICECGGKYDTKHKNGHFKTKMHITYFNSI